MHLAILGILLSFAGSFLFPGTVAAEACEEWVAKAESVQGTVQVRRAGKMQWTAVQRHDTFCPGDMIRVLERSRLGIVAWNETNHRLDANTTITITEAEPEKTFWLNLQSGAAYFFSRVPRSLKVLTPFLNAGVEGTEFFIKVESDQTFLSVFEGRVAATNPVGSLTVASGQSAIAKAGQAPALRVVVRPRDAVQWALHYPPIVDFRPADFPSEATWQAMVRQSISFYRQGDLPSAFSSIAGVPKDVRDPRFFTYQAALLLTVGRVDEAQVDIERALKLDPRNSHAFALQSIIAVVQNRNDEALRLARKAVELEPVSSAARVALSYAQQARFDLQEALASLKKAVQLPPENALSWARLAELWLSVGYLKRALDAAQRAVALNPQVARTQTVLGFALLTQIKIQDAKKAFEKATELDQAAPLPRLGLGLALIQRGKLQEGRGEIEIAASLDPNNSIIRSYLGKAYFEEKRDKLARDQFVSAKELDPQDPTPWFYDAIRKQTINRPVEALQDLQKSIELNDNRAIYRSRLLLDQDLAGRGARLGQLYRDLGFEQLALVEGWKAISLDPANHSAHRLLADSYSVLPRHEIARDSELLQSQLLQPLNLNPVQPRLLENGLAFLDNAGPVALGFNEYSQLFVRNRLRLNFDGIAGNNATLADNAIVSGIYNNLSFSVGQFHFETDGVRENNDLDENIYNAFVQVRLFPHTSLLAEFRHIDQELGDRDLFFDRNNFFRERRTKLDTLTARAGLRHSFAPNSTLIAAYTYRNTDTKDDLPEFGSRRVVFEANVHFLEMRYIHQWEWFNVSGGFGYLDGNEDQTLFIQNVRVLENNPSVSHTNGYIYAYLNYPQNLIVNLGVSIDSYDDSIIERNQVNPKVGLTWNITTDTAFRAAVFRALKRTTISSQTLEPTQVAGFNQFFDDVNGADSWLYGIALDHKMGPSVFVGGELSKRDLDIPVLFTSPTQSTVEFDRDEMLARTYFYWTLSSRFSFSTEYQFEEITDDPQVSRVALAKSTTHKVPIGLRFFHPSGLFTYTRVTYVDQHGRFQNIFTGEVAPESDNFWVADATIGYRFPKRLGLVSFEVNNLFDETFNFQDIEPLNSTISQKRSMLFRLSLTF